MHLHPSDMRGAIVALSEPRPATSWRSSAAGGPVPGCRFVGDERMVGIVEIKLDLNGEYHTIRPGVL
jgi:hypothetical protein